MHVVLCNKGIHNFLNVKRQINVNNNTSKEQEKLNQSESLFSGVYYNWNTLYDEPYNLKLNVKSRIFIILDRIYTHIYILVRLQWVNLLGEKMNFISIVIVHMFLNVM